MRSRQVSILNRAMTRILTYNVHRCLGVDGVLDPGRIASVIAACKPDIVALQELDVGRRRSGGVDQARIIAEELGMQMHFHPAMRVMEEQYGDAILTCRPSRLIKAGAIPGVPSRFGFEPRGALWAAVQVPGGELQVFNTHMGLRGQERLNQIEALLGPDWIGHPQCTEPLVLVGDFNAVPKSRAYRRVAGRLTDAQTTGAVKAAQPTFPGRMPMLRIDHVFVSGGIEVMRAEPIRSPLARAASDHLPLLVEIRLTRPSAPRPRIDMASAALSQDAMT